MIPELPQFLLGLAHELDQEYVPKGILHPVATKLRVLAAQVAGSDAE